RGGGAGEPGGAGGNGGHGGYPGGKGRGGSAGPGGGAENHRRRPGISAELLPELFERFTRGEAGRARDASAAGKSTGLGLAIVDAVVAAHGGAIVVTSRPGMTRFAILLPLLREPAGQPQASPV